MKAAKQNTATVIEAKTHLSKLIRKVQNGEIVTITSGREKKPVAVLGPVAAESKVKPQRLGALAHLNIKIPDEFFDPLTDDEMLEMFGDAFS
jgi:antitoxin (DNA-binding transcriptional repressor) of toxin-antitoxin stability system